MGEILCDSYGWFGRGGRSKSVSRCDRIVDVSAVIEKQQQPVNDDAASAVSSWLSWGVVDDVGLVEDDVGPEEMMDHSITCGNRLGRKA